jgi:hypothetical protein
MESQPPQYNEVFRDVQMCDITCFRRHAEELAPRSVVDEPQIGGVMQDYLRLFECTPSEKILGKEIGSFAVGSRMADSVDGTAEG